MDESFEKIGLDIRENLEEIKEFIREHAKKRTFKQKLKIHYLCYKFRLEDYIENLKKKWKIK